MEQRRYLLNGAKLPLNCVDEAFVFKGPYLFGRLSRGRESVILKLTPSPNAPELVELVTILSVEFSGHVFDCVGSHGFGNILQISSNNTVFKWFSTIDEKVHTIDVKLSTFPLPLCGATFGIHHLFLATRYCIYIYSLETGRLVSRLWGTSTEHPRVIRGLEIIENDKLLVSTPTSLCLWDFGSQALSRKAKIATIRPADCVGSPALAAFQMEYHRQLFELAFNINACSLSSIVSSVFHYADTSRRVFGDYALCCAALIMINRRLLITGILFITTERQIRKRNGRRSKIVHRFCFQRVPLLLNAATWPI